MKKILLSLFAVMLLMMSASPAYAFINLETKTSADLNIKSNKSNNNYSSDRNDSDKKWSFNAGVIGTVTSTNESTMEVKGENNTTYTVDISNAKVRRGTTVIQSSDISVGDSLFIQGAVNGSTIVATNVLTAKADTTLNKPSNGNNGIVGTVTAVNNTTLTVLGKNGTTYTVAGANAKVWENKKETTSLNTIAVGDTVVIQGSVNGENVEASSIYEVTLSQRSADSGIRGTVTAITGSTITLLGTDEKVYTVTTTDADIKTHKNKEGDRRTIKAGDMIVVKGEVSGTSIDAETIMEIKGKGFFNRFGVFFKKMFNAKAQ